MKKTMCVLVMLGLLLGTVAGVGNAEAMEENPKVLMAYFSCTGNTEAVAGVMAEAVNADLYEIVPETPYTDEDLNYRDDTSRASMEMNDPAARPAISGDVEDMATYDVIIVGYPIWWGVAPRIVSTFMESYDFSGKTIVAFCTSGSSGFGASDAALKETAPDAVWLEGRRFSANVPEEEIREWLQTFMIRQGA